MPILVLDVPCLCYRAKYTTGHLSYQEDKTGVAFGFLRDVAFLIGQFNTRQLVFCFDSRNNKRKELYFWYKASRAARWENLSPEEKGELHAFRKQMERLKTEWLPRIGFKNVYTEHGYEADDLIAYICKRNRSEHSLVIVSTDKDFYQCLHKNVSIWNPQTKKLLTQEWFENEYEIHPRQWAEVKAIAGCVSDEVPGIVRVGEKTAIKYIRNQLPKNTKIYQSIVAGKDVIKRNRKLVGLPFDNFIQCSKIEPDEFNQVQWNKVCRELGIRTLLNA